MNNKNESSLNIKIILLIFILAISFYLRFYHGSIDSFAFQHIGFIKKYDSLGHVFAEDPFDKTRYLGTPGFYVFGIVFSQVTNIPFDLLCFLPILLMPAITLLFSILKNINPNYLLCSLLILIFTTFSWNSGLNFWIHGMGLVDFFLVILFSIILAKTGSKSTKMCLGLLMILTIISANFVSYKSTLWIISFLFVSLIIENFLKLYSRRLGLDLNMKFPNFINFTLVCAIYSFFFNEFVYKTFLPAWRIREESSQGIDKLFLFFFKNTNDPLSLMDFYYSPPGILKFIVASRQVIFILLIIFCTWKLLNLIRKYNVQFFEYNYRLYFSMCLVIALSSLVYNLLGAFDVGMIIYLGYMSILILDKLNIKKIAFFSVIMLLILNIGYNITIHEYNPYTRDDNYFNYIQGSNWYQNYGENKLIKTDILTKGYYIKELALDEKTIHPIHFTVDDILFITDNKDDYKDKVFFVVNYRLSYISIADWRILKSMYTHKNEIESNTKINKIYTSKDIAYYFN